MNYADILQARRDAAEQIRLADLAAVQAAQLIAGRLRDADVWPETLVELKRELKQFDAVKRRWKGPK